MTYRALHSFIAFGKTVEAGEKVELTLEQAKELEAQSLIAPYEIKIDPVPERTGKKKQLVSSPLVRAQRLRTRSY